jgi:hypothetical protein
MYGSTRHGQNAVFILREVWIDIEDYALFSQGADGRTHIRYAEPEYCVLMRREISHGRDAQRDSADVENGGEAVGQPVM